MATTTSSSWFDSPKCTAIFCVNHDSLNDNEWQVFEAVMTNKTLRDHYIAVMKKIANLVEAEGYMKYTKCYAIQNLVKAGVYEYNKQVEDRTKRIRRLTPESLVRIATSLITYYGPNKIWAEL